LNRKVLSLQLKTVRESLVRTVHSSEFQTVGAEDRKARLETVTNYYVVILSAFCIITASIIALT